MRSHGACVQALCATATSGLWKQWIKSDLYPMRLADWDMDGDLDAIVLMEDGLWLFKMIARGQNFSGPFLLNNSALNVNYNSYLEVADWNVDGYPDILFAEQVRTISGPSGCTDGKIRYFEQMHLDSEMVLQERTGSNNPFDVISVPCPDRYTTLQLADWNADGKPDLFVYSPELIKLRYFENHHGQLLEATHRPGRVFHVSIEKRILVELLTSVLYGLTPMNQELIFCWHWNMEWFWNPKSSWVVGLLFGQVFPGPGFQHRQIWFREGNPTDRLGWRWGPGRGWASCGARGPWGIDGLFLDRVSVDRVSVTWTPGHDPSLQALSGSCM